MRDVLHWLPVSQGILYRIPALVWRSVTGCAACAPSYLTDLCRREFRSSFPPALRSSARGELLVITLLLAPPLGINSLLHSACYLRTTCLLSASVLRYFSLTVSLHVAGLRAPLSRFLEGALYKYPI